MFEYAGLRRWPDVEGENLFASDAADRLIAEVARDAVAALGDSAGGLVIVGDAYGALTLAAAAGGARGIRVHQDPLTGEQALAANAAALGLADAYTQHPLDADLVRGARVVLLRLPRSLDALDEIATLVAEHAHPEVVVYAGGMLKHMSMAMNDVLGAAFDSVTASLARQKARVLTAERPHPVADLRTGRWPERAYDDELGVWVCAHGAAFAGTAIDIGTRFLLSVVDDAAPDARTAIDLGCGTGVLATTLAIRRPELRVIATDQSAAAVASATATAAANGVADRVAVVRDDGLSAQPDASADLIVLNPPFHIGSAVHTGVAHRMFADAARVLAPGGELWTVWNSHLGYRAALERTVGPTRQIARNAKFTVTASRRR
ncbi:class I SAM-dependent methyltransferase [Leifsonia sp. Root227]|uniref:class I SAM-dependent methyltransferase n=1 Tax=Leifsonia sp. Root227 TaxID=1736496 RepID=UPI000AF5AD6E|nr:class I SAM-dependent methyltransferase [Leifsonia sp. Root227]